MYRRRLPVAPQYDNEVKDPPTRAGGTI